MAPTDPPSLVDRLDAAADYHDERGEPSRASIEALPALLREAAARLRALEPKPFRMEVTKEWCEKMAALEEGHEVGAGNWPMPPDNGFCPSTHTLRCTLERGHEGKHSAFRTQVQWRDGDQGGYETVETK